MAKVVTFGELMIRLQPYNYERFVQADHLEFSFGGGEANVAVSLANYGLDAAYVTKLPAHAIGQAAVNSLRRYGVDTRHVLRGGSRLNRGRLLLRRLFGGGGEIGVKIFHLVRLGEVLEHQVQLLFLQRGHAFFRRVHILSQQLDHFLAGRSKILGNLAYAVFNHHMAESSSKSCRQCRLMAAANPLSSVASTPTGFW